MFDIGWSELVVIAVVALVAIGPKELPGVLRSVGQWMTKIRRMAAEFQGQFQEAMREAEMADLKKQADDLNDAARNLTQNFDPFDYVPKDEPKKDEVKPAVLSQTSDAGASSDVVSVDTAVAALEQPVPDAGGEPVPAAAPEPAPPQQASEPTAPPAGGRAA
jgi:sec-independent protein translocase protein TatB